MRNFTLLALLLFSFAGASAQRKCGTETALAQKLKDQPKLVAKMQAVETTLRKIRPPRNLQRVNPRVTIPVVVHIVLPDPSVVTDQQILSQIASLNLDYIAQNPDIVNVPAAWQAIIGNSELQFCLAARTPDGDPSGGITRTVTQRSGFSINGAAADVKYTSTGGTPGWDNTRFLNIWVCVLDDNFLGVATPPGNVFPAEEDGVVVNYRAFGTNGSARAPFNLGRTLTHEIGHYFGLRHIWGDDNGNCSGDDGVGDTPLQGSETYGCPAGVQTDMCSPIAPGYMYMNYMDYVNDACMILFSTGQTDRMRNALDAQRASLLNSDGCIPVNLRNVDAGIAEVQQPTGYRCEAGQTPLVLLKNRGFDALTSATIRYTVNDGPPVDYNWTGNLATLQQTPVTLPIFQAGQGTFTLKAWTLNPNGGADEQPENDTASVSFNYRSPSVMPFTETFEGAAFPPDAFSIRNPDRSFTWERASVGSRGSSRSAFIRNLGYATNNEVDDLIGPVVDGSVADSVFVSFDLAAAVATLPGTPGNAWDTLEVMVTLDCGQTFIPTGYKKWGATLMTRRTPTDVEFVPTASEWRTDTVDLTPFVKKQPFRVVFRNTTNYENNVYIDQVNIFKKDANPDLVSRGILIWPNAFRRQFYIEFSSWPEDLKAIAVYDAAGRQVYRQQPVIRSGNRTTIDLVNASNGVYFVTLFYSQQVRTYKIVKAK
ncbi:M43 family zinc metalloprotease [Chitinophaga barathri]|uniref:T9SS C-terminal target domain-containing protein n=1 Tax=Chitinophaga barathri TaxID=1647451 RepID=A0A3N4MPC3_9BACT|nr:M43 family zinc metalloprotease [Chitinophaga barathri]RPD41920.1 T9SS C-terminal target domain-containing protein [Chitinophaga barathri]